MRTGQKTVRLNQMQKIAMTDYIRSNWARILEERPRKDVFVSQAAEALNLPQLNENHVNGILTALGLKMPYPKLDYEHRKKTSGSVTTRHISLVRRVEKAEKKLSHIFDVFGIDPDDFDA